MVARTSGAIIGNFEQQMTTHGRPAARRFFDVGADLRQTMWTSRLSAPAQALVRLSTAMRCRGVGCVISRTVMRRPDAWCVRARTLRSLSMILIWRGVLEGASNHTCTQRERSEIFTGHRRDNQHIIMPILTHLAFEDGIGMFGRGLLLAMFWVPTICMAGPFGIDMGSSINTHDVAKTESKFTFNSVPSPHPLFVEYSGWQTTNTGVCRVLAISKTYENDAFGSNLRSDFERITDALNAKYGRGEKIDILRTGSIWDEPRDWVMSIRQNERTYAYSWSDPSSEDGDYSLIQMWVVGLSGSDSVMILEYRAAFFEECSDLIEAEADSSL